MTTNLNKTSLRLLALLGLLALVAAAVPVASAATAELQITATPAPATSPAGTEGSLRFDVQNVGQATATGIRVEVDEVPDGIYFNGTTRADLGSLGAGSKTSVTPFVYEVGKNTEPGYFHVAFDVDFHYDDGGNTIYGGFRLTGTIVVRSDTSLQVGPLAPESLDPGSTQTVLVNVTNHGSTDIGPLTGTWTDPNGVVLPYSSSSTFFVDDLGAGETRQVPVRMAASASATPGVYALQFSLAFDDVNGERVTQDFTVGIMVGGGTKFDVSPSDASGGSLTLNVANIGVNEAGSVLVEVLPSAGATTSTSSDFVGDLVAGDFSIATVDIQVQGGQGGQGNPGGQTVFLRISYTDTAGARQSVETQVRVSSTSLQSGSNGDLPSLSGGGPGRVGAPAWYANPLLWGVLVVAAGVVFLVVRKRRKKAFDFQPSTLQHETVSSMEWGKPRQAPVPSAEPAADAPAKPRGSVPGMEWGSTPNEAPRRPKDE